jgi:predicted Fe-S protein YdhL (DUF1289 family)
MSKHSTSIESDKHASDTNPCLGICQLDAKGYCIGCYRTQEEREKWYTETIEWREDTLKALSDREDKAFE